VIRIDVPRFDLSATLESGQFFRWRRAGDAFEIETHGRLFSARQQGDALHVEGADEAFAHSFFALDHDIAAIEEALARDPKLRPALDHAPGLRILRQDPWECAAAFLISMASNIPRITRNVADVARAFGRPLSLGAASGHAFPRPHEIADEADLRRLGLGFRARYVAAAARLAQAGLLDEAAGQPAGKAKEILMRIPGVGEKVADCILLFAFGHLEAFPVDTWIRRVMRKVFLGGRRRPDRAIRSFASGRWDGHAGYAQQYLYVWSRVTSPRRREPGLRPTSR
jgi:N-glycosylase/DNA lyase